QHLRNQADQHRAFRHAFSFALYLFPCDDSTSLRPVPIFPFRFAALACRAFTELRWLNKYYLVPPIALEEGGTTIITVTLRGRTNLPIGAVAFAFLPFPKRTRT